MDAPAAESDLALKPHMRWLARERATGRFYRYAAIISLVALLTIAALSVWLLSRGAEPGAFLSPELLAVLLVANLVPAIALMVLSARRLALRRAESGGVGTGHLHTRLVALFSGVAAVPTVLVVIFASFLFQSGSEFWFSDRARGMLENAAAIAQDAYDREVQRVSAETIAMSSDVAGYLEEVAIDDPRFADALARIQV